MSDEPATKADISELRAELKGDIAGLRAELKSDMQGMERRLLLEIGHALNVAVEQIGSKVAVIDEKYQALPARVDSLERTVDEHRADYRLHKRPARVAPKTSRPTRRRPPK